MTFPPFDNPLLTFRPHGTAEINHVFGDPTRDGLYLKVPDPDWVKRCIVELHGDEAFLPVLAKTYYPVHRLAEPSTRAAFQRAEQACPGYIHREGTYGWVFRHQRHDPARPLSRHAWGIANDVNPDDNQAHEFAPGKTPIPWSPEWVSIWPRGVPRGVVDAFKSCGFAWGGDWKGFVDPMHFELCGSAVQI